VIKIGQNLLIRKSTMQHRTVMKSEERLNTPDLRLLSLAVGVVSTGCRPCISGCIRLRSTFLRLPACRRFRLVPLRVTAGQRTTTTSNEFVLWNSIIKVKQDFPGMNDVEQRGVRRARTVGTVLSGIFYRWTGGARFRSSSTLLYFKVLLIP
jgi:hypothetical protein